MCYGLLLEKEKFTWHMMRASFTLLFNSFYQHVSVGIVKEGLEVKCFITSLQRKRGSNGVWMLEELNCWDML